MWLIIVMKLTIPTKQLRYQIKFNINLPYITVLSLLQSSPQQPWESTNHIIIKRKVLISTHCPKAYVIFFYSSFNKTIMQILNKC